MRRNRKNSAYDSFKEFLTQGRKLNSLIAEKEFGIKHNTCCYYIWRMRKEGYKISTEKKQSFTGRDYAEYRIEAA